MKQNLTVCLLLAIVLFLPVKIFAHCDGLDGPVVAAARESLESGDVNGVLIWVKKQDESAIRDAFEQTLAVRKLSPQAKEMADRYFFETLVRIHRAGEGAPFDGLKPAGRDLGPAIPAADKAVRSGSIDTVSSLLSDSVKSGLEEKFRALQTKKQFDKSNVEAGREYVAAYVEFIHYVERLYEASANPAEGHFEEHR
jgi:hypothetical protein